MEFCTPQRAIAARGVGSGSAVFGGSLQGQNLPAYSCPVVEKAGFSVRTGQKWWQS